MPEATSWLGIDWSAVLAFATVVLAVATFWLGLQTRRLSGTTTEELDLLRAQTKAQQDQVELLQRQAESAERDREELTRSQLVWGQRGATTVMSPEGHRGLEISLYLENHGPQIFLGKIQFASDDLRLQPRETEANTALDSSGQYPILVKVWGYEAQPDHGTVAITVLARLFAPQMAFREFPVNLVVTRDGQYRLVPPGT